MEIIFKNKALLILVIIVLTDKLDGLFARLTKQTTTFGKIFDSFTDWSVILMSFGSFYFIGLLESYWVILMIVPSVINGVIKLFYFKKEKDVILVPVAQAAVGFTYLTLVIILFNFTYKYLFLIIMLAFIYVAMFRYIYLFLKDNQKPKLSFRKGF